MLYIIGTRVDTTRSIDPRMLSRDNRRIASWLPAINNDRGQNIGAVWVLGRISKTRDAETLDYMFYLEQNPQRTHVVTFENAEQADQAISTARGETIVDEPDRKELNPDKKFDQVADDLNRRQAADPRRGGRPGNMGRRMGR